LGKTHCTKCKKFRHNKSNCWQRNKKKHKFNKKEKEKEKDKEGNTQKKPKVESSNQSIIVGELPSAHIEELLCIAKENMGSDQNADYNGECYGFDTYQATDEIDERLIFHDWYVDSATTSHIANSCNAFSSYQSITDTAISGVGDAITHAEGCRTVTLTSKYHDQIYMLQLQDVLHVPSNKNNLFSLGCWDATGNTYSCKGGVLTLWAQNKPVAMAEKTNNNLYLLDVKAKHVMHKIQAMNANAKNGLDSWATWHKHYRHIGYTGLQTILDHQMVTGFKVDLESIKSNCTVCIQVKMSKRPFGPTTNRTMEIG
jgi:hypothetical protein